MAGKNAQGVYDFIMAYVNKSGVAYSNWYVGIASDPETRLFTEHKVNKNGHWVYEFADSEATARYVEKYIIETHKTQGDTGGGDASTTSVYAYVVTPTTKE